MFGLETDIFILLCIALLAACAFEFINGFHDTANAVATVIYTNSLKPTQAVIWSGVMNFLGVITGGVGVGMSIVNLLPVELLIDQNVYHAIAMVMALLLSAIIWNLGTWYFGIPSSSSHTLIGAIIGVGLGFALLPGNEAGIAAINWDKAKSVFSGLLLAPVIGFTLAIGLMLLLKKLLNDKAKQEIFSEPNGKSAPPFWIRSILIITCTLVSFFHGRNDGQKGIGLIMLILIGVLPTFFAVNSDFDLKAIQPDIKKINQIVDKIEVNSLSVDEQAILVSLKSEINELETLTKTPEAAEGKGLDLRRDILLISSQTKNLLDNKQLSISATERNTLRELVVKEEQGIRRVTDYAPFWAILMVSLSLGLGTMIGWKRIVITVGEKIGKTHLTYAQGAS
ncbi:MAG: inorganic phosphate transporter, partial [Spirosomaceae bacterium]|nr:inorganic phosphate transporter [Spirosomataceae bacterium]